MNENERNKHMGLMGYHEETYCNASLESQKEKVGGKEYNAYLKKYG